MKTQTFQPTDFTRGRGTKIRDARLRRGLTQQALADLVGVSRVMVSYWESGLVESIPLPQVFGLMTHLDLGLLDVYGTLRLPRDVLDALHSHTAKELENLGAGAQSPAARLAQRRLSEPALTLAMLWDELPHANELKRVAAELIEQAHRAHDPKYWEWSDGQAKAAAQRPSKTKPKSSK